MPWDTQYFDVHPKQAWNAGRKVDVKRALKHKEVWAIRFWLDQEGRLRDRALSIWRSTVSCAGAISSRCGSAIW
jgi:hypothetical protein